MQVDITHRSDCCQDRLLNALITVSETNSVEVDRFSSGPVQGKKTPSGIVCGLISGTSGTERVLCPDIQVADLHICQCILVCHIVAHFSSIPQGRYVSVHLAINHLTLCEVEVYAAAAAGTPAVDVLLERAPAEYSFHTAQRYSGEYLGSTISTDRLAQFRYTKCGGAFVLASRSKHPHSHMNHTV